MASMTYLQIAQFAHRVLRLGNAQPGSQPVTIPAVANLDQLVYDLIDTVPRAWEKIQDEHPSWNFMRKQGVKAFPAGTRTFSLAQMQSSIPDYYGIIPFFGSSDSPYVLWYDSGLPSTSWVDYIYPFIEYIDWRGWWDRQPRPANAQPNRITEWPDKTIECDPAAAVSPVGGAWTLKFDYRIKNQVLAAATDVPILPPEFHEMIGYLTVMMIAESRQNQNPIWALANKRYTEYMDRLKARYLPQLQVDTTYCIS